MKRQKTICESILKARAARGLDVMNLLDDDLELDIGLSSHSASHTS